MHYRSVVLDFDGTIFRLFWNYDLNKTKQALISLLNVYEVGFDVQNDAFEVFGKIYDSELDKEIKSDLLEKANEIIKCAEIEALSTGVLIDGFTEFLGWIDSSKYSIAVATNNSEGCVREFFSRYYNRTDCIVVGRDCQRPDLMKPHTYMLEKMCELLKLSCNEICFVGDSLRDYDCAFEFGCRFVGMASTSRKKEKLQKSIGESMIVENYKELISKGII